MKALLRITIISSLKVVFIFACLSCNSNHNSDEEYFEIALNNGISANEGFRRCLDFTHAWLGYADPVSGLFPENLYAGNDTWNAHNSAADNYPFMVLTSLILDKELYNGTMHQILASERKLSSRLNSLPDDYSLNNHTFARESVDTGRIIFGASEYIKDGLIPLTEYAGETQWSERMLEMLDDLSELVSVAQAMSWTGFRKSVKDEINGELLQILSRMFWMTGEERYLEWAVRIGNHYLIESDLASTERIRLRDHGCEIIAGLSELYFTLHYTDTDKKSEFQPALYAALDRILEVARNEHGMLYNEVNLQTGEILDSNIVDNWGYIYNAYYTVYLIDDKLSYREAALLPMDHLINHYRNFNWERGSSDGFADAIESGINLYNRESNSNLEAWINSEIQVMWSLQDSSYQERALGWKNSGVIEGWHGDGNFARTTLMYCLWKTSGLTIEPWRPDVVFGSTIIDETLYVTIRSEKPWKGTLKFDPQRHRTILHLPMDYPRINQFQEWYSIIEDREYLLQGTENQSIIGTELLKGIDIETKLNQDTQLKIRNIGQP